MPLIPRSVNLHFIAVVDPVPRIVRHFSHSNKHAGIGVLARGLEYDPDGRVAEFLGGIDQQPHATLSLEQPVHKSKFSRAGHLPSGQILSIE